MQKEAEDAVEANEEVAEDTKILQAEAKVLMMSSFTPISIV